MRLIIKINKEPVGEYEVGPTDEYSFECVQSDSTKSRSFFEKEIAYFEAFRQEFKKAGGVVRGLETEFAQFRKHKDWKDELPKLVATLLLEKAYRAKKVYHKEFIAPIKNLKFWLKDRCWEIEYEQPRATPTLERTVQFQSE